MSVDPPRGMEDRSGGRRRSFPPTNQVNLDAGGTVREEDSKGSENASSPKIGGTDRIFDYGSLRWRES